METPLSSIMLFHPHHIPPLSGWPPWLSRRHCDTKSGGRQLDWSGHVTFDSGSESWAPGGSWTTAGCRRRAASWQGFPTSKCSVRTPWSIHSVRKTNSIWLLLSRFLLSACVIGLPLQFEVADCLIGQLGSIWKPFSFQEVPFQGFPV